MSSAITFPNHTQVLSSAQKTINNQKLNEALVLKTKEPTNKTALLSLDNFSLDRKQMGFWDVPNVEMTSNQALPKPNDVPTDMLRYLFLQQAMNPQENARLKLHLNNMGEPLDGNFFALHDALSLLEKPVDVIVTSTVFKSGLSALVHPKSQSFMTPQATIILMQGGDPLQRLQKNTTIQTDRWLEDQCNQTLATQIIDKAGSVDRKKLLNTLKARDGRNSITSLQALHMGKRGLINGILVGANDRIILRQDLDAFLKRQKETKQWTEKDINNFLQDGHRAEEIPSSSLNEAFPESMPDVIKATQHKAPQLFKRKVYTAEPIRGDLPPAEPYQLPRECQISETSKQISPTFILKHIEKPHNSILGNDAVFFTNVIDQDAVNRTIQALKRFDVQRRTSGSLHHLAVFLSSEGGGPSFSKLFIDTIKRLKTPVDVIVTGVAASSASMDMLAPTTGKRLATPGASFMLHETAASGKSNDVGDDVKKEFESSLRDLAEKTGRSFNDLRQDTSKDYWLSALDALYYGEKGLIDGILVGPRHVITRSDVTDYLKEKLGSQEAVHTKIKERLERRRDMSQELDHKFNSKDPLDNFYTTIQEVAKRKNRILGVDSDFLHSGPNPDIKSIEHLPVKAYKPFGVTLPFKFTI